MACSRTGLGVAAAGQPPVDKTIAIADCHLHHYGKAFKAGRKVGHATLRCADRASLNARIADVQALIAEV